MKPVMLIVGTRPECIKMMPVYAALQRAGVPTLLCSTAQHGAMLTELFMLFGVQPDVTLDVMRPQQDLFYLTAAVLEKTKSVYLEHQPSIVLVQGDTTTAMAAALAAFYLHIPVVHIEAGLRTHDLRAPFPEEMNRRVISTFATAHCVPTLHARENLRAEGVAEATIFCTGNTVVDALTLMQKRIQEGAVAVSAPIVERVAVCQKLHKKIMILTAHRRESFGGGIAHALGAVMQFLRTHPDVYCFFPVHPNPQVHKELEQVAYKDLENVYVSRPLAYQDLVYLMTHADGVITDSGGMQEEAVSLGKPVIVLRENTERQEAVVSGLAQLVGTDPEKIKTALQQVFHGADAEQKTSCIYGDGDAAKNNSSCYEACCVKRT